MRPPQLVELTKEARGILGIVAPQRGLLVELRAAWRLMRAALVAVAAPVYSLSEFDACLLRIDNGLGPTAASALIDPKHLTVRLKQVMKSWECSEVEFCQAGANICPT